MGDPLVLVLTLGKQVGVKKKEMMMMCRREGAHRRDTCHKVNNKYERSRLELSFINLGMRSHSRYEL